jgi:hypothetical protein
MRECKMNLNIPYGQGRTGSLHPEVLVLPNAPYTILELNNQGDESTMPNEGRDKLEID